MNRSLRFALAATAATVAAGAGTPMPALAEAYADERASYSYVRTIEGSATLASSLRAPGEPVDLHEPLQLGDRIQVEPGARLEVVLADRNLLRVGGGGSLRLAQVAFSADGDDRSTQLDLERGEILLTVTDAALGDSLPEIRTPEGTVYVHEPGSYRLLLSSTGELQLTVREGYAELLTARGSTVVRGGEEAWTAGDRWGSVQVGTAGPRSALERWGDDLGRRAERATYRELRVEPHLAYAASTLDDYGSWIYLDSSWSWRPRVAVGWRPYWEGRWAWTPSGMTWVSAEPWGWVPYHYGSWRMAPGYGWVWQPGRRYSPAWVYWFVGPTWTGWCPVGYYTHHYRNYWDAGFRFGVYGWAAGHWGFYADWSFLPTGRVGVRNGRDWRRTGSHLGRTEAPNVPRGVLTTDTAGLPRERWERPAELVREFERRGGADARLTEVTDFVARRPALDPTVERAVRRDPTARGEARHGSPLDPGASIVETRRGGSPGVEGWRERANTGRRGSGDPAAASRRANPTPSDPLDSGFGRGRGSNDNGARGDADAREVAGRGVSGWRQSPVDRRDAPTVGRADDRPATAANDRQGWRRSSGTGASGSAAAPPAWGRTDSPSDRGDRDRTGAIPRAEAPSGEPVSRVVGGVRRTPPTGERSFAAPPAGGNPSHERPPIAARPISPLSGWSAPTAATPPAGWRGAPGSSAPRGTPPPSARAATPPPSRGVTSPPTTQQAAGNRNRGATVSNRGGNSSGGSGGDRAKASSSGHRGQSSQSSSSPPPRRQRPPADGG